MVLSLHMRVHLLRISLIVILLPVVLAQSPSPYPYPYPSTPGVPQVSLQQIVFSALNFMIFGSVTLRDSAVDYVDVYTAYAAQGTYLTDIFLDAYVQQYRVLRSQISPYSNPTNATLLITVESYRQRTSFFDRFMQFFFGNTPDVSKARVFLYFFLSFIMSIGTCFAISLPLPPDFFGFKSSFVEGFIVALLSTSLLSFWGVTSRFVSLFLIVLMCVSISIIYSLVFVKGKIHPREQTPVYVVPGGDFYRNL